MSLLCSYDGLAACPVIARFTENSNMKTTDGTRWLNEVILTLLIPTFFVRRSISEYHILHKCSL